MGAPAAIDVEAAGRPRGLARVRAAAAAVAAGVLGAAPHMLHRVGPLAGAALLAGASGKLLFGAIGFVLAVPMLRTLRQRTGSWRMSGSLLALMALVFAFSAFVIGPALTGADEEAAPGDNVPGVPAGVSPEEHESHHP